MKGALGSGRGLTPGTGWRPAALACAVLVVVVGGTLAAAKARPGVLQRPPTMRPAEASALSRLALSVDGNKLLRHGRPFVVHGVTMIAFLSPASHARGKERLAFSRFGRQELVEARAYGANTIRFPVSLGALLPRRNRWYDPAYLTSLARAVRMTRHLGMNTILTLDAERGSDVLHCPLPNRGAEAAWQRLARRFGHERDVMFELYNEPFMHATQATWRLWLHGGRVLYKHGRSCNAIGMQRLVDVIRANHSENVIVAPGLQLERTLTGVPLLSDPAHGRQIAYGVHVESYRSVARWRYEFGYLAARAPVIVTEWNAAANSQHCPAWERAGASRGAATLLDYLSKNGIGVVGYAFDSPDTLRRFYGSRLTTFDGFACRKPFGGPGELLHSYFKSQPDSP